MMKYLADAMLGTFDNAVGKASSAKNFKIKRFDGTGLR